jgi:replicative DNA helicase
MFESPNREEHMGANNEKLLISSVINEQSLGTALKQGVTDEMFRSFGEEWYFINEFYSKHGKIPDKKTIERRFPGFLVADTVDTEYFAYELKQSHTEWLLADVIKDAALMLSDKDVNGALKYIHDHTMKIAQHMGMVDDTDIFDAEDELYLDIQERVNRFEIYGSSGIPTGFPSIDEAIGGLNPGELIILGARLGVGKSYLLQRMAASAVTHGHTVQFDALEQTRSQVNIRIMSMLSGKIGQSVFSSKDLMQGKNIDLVEWRRFLRTVRNEIPGKLHVADARSGPLDFTTINGQIERNKPGILFIDYLTLMKKQSNNWQDIVGLSNGCKLIAMKNQIPVVAAAQLNREGGITKDADDMPGVEALAYSDAIGHDADIVITAKKMSQRVLCLYMAKNRNGFAGFKTWVRFSPDAGRFEEVDYTLARDMIDEDKTREHGESLG